MNNTRGADLLVAALSCAGVKNVFTLSGNQIMPVFDACIDSDLRLIHVRHEAAAVHMADAWGRLTTEPGVALVTAGPGFANTLSALYVAAMAESPLVLISGHAPISLSRTAVQETTRQHSQSGQGEFQQMPQAEMAAHVCKASWTITDENLIGHELARAFRLARSGRPGPVHLAIPFDVLNTDVAGFRKSIPQTADFHPLVCLLDVDSGRNILTAIRAATRPVILAGPCSMRANGPQLMLELEQATHVPVIATESPRGINDPSLGGFSEVIAQADLVLLVGKTLDFTLRFGNSPAFDSECRFIHVDPDTSVLELSNKNLDANRLIGTELADAIPCLERLIQLSSEIEWSEISWHGEVRSAIAHRSIDESPLRPSNPQRLHAVQVCSEINELLAQSSDSVFISDGGEFGQWAQAFIKADHRVINGPSGAIGSAIPFAIAARLAFPDSVIVACLGDGTFGFHPFEFDTAVRYNLPFVAVIGNDACWNAEHQIQLREYGADRTHSCELNDTPYHEVVQSLGGFGKSVNTGPAFSSALKQSLESNKPACINVSIDRVPAPTFHR
jgi:acetolactate synthase I/II/III large subunit